MAMTICRCFGNPLLCVANMERAQLDFLRSLDPEGMDGTVQTFLMNYPDLPSASFETVICKLVVALLRDKASLVRSNVEAWRKVDELQK